MKRLIFYVSCVLMVFSSAHLAAQTPPPQPKQLKGEFRQKMEERIKTQHIAFISNRLQLTPKEAEQFWPLFNEFHSKQKTMREAARTDRQKPFDEMTDAEVEKLIAGELDLQSRELELRKEYYQKFKAIISVKKIAKLYRAERDFKMTILENFKKRKFLGGDKKEFMRPQRD